MLRNSGITVWVDEQGLTPGTADWQEAIRTALQASYAVIFLASPNSGPSVYVQAELKHAQKYKCTILPLWIQGDDWLDCVPMDLINTQYIDARDEKLEMGIHRAIKSIVDIVERIFPRHFEHNTEIEHPNFIQVQVDTSSYVYFSPLSFHSVEELLNELYLNFLFERYPPYTYGEIWVLTARNIYKRVILPHEWLLQENRNKAVVEFMPSWSHYKLQDIGLNAGTKWKIEEPKTLKIVGVATSFDGMRNIGLSVDRGNFSIKPLLYIISKIRNDNALGIRKEITRKFFRGGEGVFLDDYNFPTNDKVFVTAQKPNDVDFGDFTFVYVLSIQAWGIDDMVITIELP